MDIIIRSIIELQFIKIIMQKFVQTGRDYALKHAKQLIQKGKKPKKSNIDGKVGGDGKNKLYAIHFAKKILKKK